MDRYLEKIMPTINGLNSLTLEKKIKWTKVGDNAFRCIDEKNNLSIEISKIPPLNKVNIKLFNQSDLEFEYKSTLLNSDATFDNALIVLYNTVDTQYLEKVTSHFNDILNSLS